ncbi:MAG: hypothetical protein HRT44_03325, partial [Bdellovibrionales bacterium]|nr:hypothetical protein [Bdellovibrionales bacterium]NQZ18278.1 hypothetical protein [Bdellovibrionales bacterium]
MSILINFAIGNGQFRSIGGIVDSLSMRGIKYDFIIVGLTVQGFQSMLEEFRFHYSMRWTPDPHSWFKSWVLLRQALARHWQRDAHLRSFVSHFKIKEAVASTYLHPAFMGKSVYDLSFRQNLKYQKFFVELPFEEPTQEQLKSYRLKFEELYTKLKAIGSKVYWSPIRIAYSEDALAEYEKRAVYVLPAKNFVKTDPKFYNYKSLNNVFKRRNEYLYELLTSLNIEPLDWSGNVNQHLGKRGDLYLDEFHLTAAGGKIAAEFIASRIKQHP